MAMRIIGYPLPEAVEEDLISLCEVTGDDPAAVVIDAVTLFLDDASEVFSKKDAAETVPPPCGVTGRGPREGFAGSDIAERFRGLMDARRALRSEADAS